MSAPPVCRLCGSGSTLNLGRIPASDYFAGRVLPELLAGGCLWACESCSSQFRHPTLSAERYLELYRAGAPEQWSASEQRAEHWDGGQRREDVRVIRAILEAASAVDVLDVGCGAGEFLASLPASFVKFGVEPSPAAAQLAVNSGIRILGGSIEECGSGQQFDAVTVIDVIEHLPDVGSFLARACTLLRPGGLLIVSTGDPDNQTWRRWLKHRFWYVSFPEHITFPSQRFFESWCARSNSVLRERQVIRYQRLGVARRMLGTLIQLAFCISPAAFNGLGRALRGKGTGSARQTFAPGVPGTFRDHQVVVMQKRVASGPWRPAEEKVRLNGAS